MAVGVGHTFGGDVVVVNLSTDLRLDLSPDQAEAAAARCEQAAADGHWNVESIIVLEALDGRAFRFAAIPADHLRMAEDLRSNAATGRLIKLAAGMVAPACATPANENGGGDAA